MAHWFQDDARFFLGIALALYGLAFLFAGISLVQQRRYLRPVLLSLIVGAWVFNTFGLTLRGYEVRACPLGNPFEIIQFITWSAVGFYVLVFPFYRINLLGFFTTAFAFFLGGASLLVPGWDHPYEKALFGGNPWVELHAALAISSYGIFGLLALIALMYLLQQHALKAKQSKPFFRFLPSINELDAVGLRLLAAGHLVFTVSLLVGSLYWVPHFDNVSILKLLSSLLLWVAYSASLLFRVRNRLVARNFAWTCVALFGFALLSLWPVDSSRHRDAPALAQSPSPEVRP